MSMALRPDWASGFYTGKVGLSSLSLPLEDDDFEAFEVAYGEFLEDYKAALDAVSLG